jgi:hypothetical protein
MSAREMRWGLRETNLPDPDKKFTCSKIPPNHIS